MSGGEGGEKVVAAVERFYLEILGQVLPGAFLIAGLSAVVGPVSIGHASLGKPEGTVDVLVAVGFCYILGHALGKVGEAVIVPAFSLLAIGIRKAVEKSFGMRMWREIVTRHGLATELATDASVTAFAVKMGRLAPSVDSKNVERDVRSLRSSAMSLLSTEDKATVVRFMFMSIFHSALATGCWAVGAAAATQIPFSWITFGRIGLALIASVPFLFRHFEFRNRSMRVAFDMANARWATPATAQVGNTNP